MVDYISTKIKRGTDVMKKTSKFLDKNSLLMLYITLVETHLRYCNVVWGQCNALPPHRQTADIAKYQAARVITAARIVTKVKYEDVDHLRLFCQLGWLTVRGLIKFDLGIFMYKSQNNLLPETAGKFHIPAEMVHGYGTRSAVPGNVFLPRYDLSFTQKSRAFSGAKIWNEIPVNIKKAPSVDSFKEKRKAYYLQTRKEI